MIILCDVDSVVAELMTPWLARYNEDYDDNLTADNILAWSTHEFVKPECGKKIYDYLNDPDLYVNCPPIEGALDGVNTLKQKGHRVVFVTAATAEGMGAKLKWLCSHGFLDMGGKNECPDFIAAKDKGLLRGDVMIDDGVHNLDSAYVKYCILFDQPWNQENLEYARAIGWAGVLEAIESLEDWNAK